MFSVALLTREKQSFAKLQQVCVDSLPEAEILALKLACKYYRTNAIMIVHRGNLEYDIYETFAPIGSIRIKTL